MPARSCQLDCPLNIGAPRDRVPAAAASRRETTGRRGSVASRRAAASVSIIARIDVGRIGLDRPFVAGGQRMPLQHGRRQAAESAPATRCVGVPPPKYSVSTSRGVLPELQPVSSSIARKIIANQIIAPGHEREIAIAAAMPAERHVDVRGSRRHRWRDADSSTYRCNSHIVRLYGSPAFDAMFQRTRCL